jgi:predicted TPR repeat methyltransferase
MPEDRSRSIADIGCGCGFALRALRKLGFKNLLGIEVSPEQAARCHQAGFEVVLVENVIDWLQENRERFAVVLLLDVLEHIPVPEQIEFVRAINRTLQCGGKLVLTVPNASAILSMRWRYIDYTHYSSFTEHSLYFVLKNAGFENIEIDSSKGIGRFPRRLWKWSTWAGVRKWMVRWCWLQVLKSEIPWENINEISFELNLKAVATKP